MQKALILNTASGVIIQSQKLCITEDEFTQITPSSIIAVSGNVTVQGSGGAINVDNGVYIFDLSGGRVITTDATKASLTNNLIPFIKSGKFAFNTNFTFNDSYATSVFTNIGTHPDYSGESWATIWFTGSQPAFMADSQTVIINAPTDEGIIHFSIDDTAQATIDNNPSFRIGNAKLGRHLSFSSSYFALWHNNTTNSSNYTLLSDGTDTSINAAGVLYFRVANSVYAQLNNTGVFQVNVSITTPIIRATSYVITNQISTTSAILKLDVPALTTGQTGGNGDAYIRVNNPGGVSFLALCGGYYQNPFSTDNSAGGAQIILGGNQGLWPGHVYIQAGTYNNVGQIWLQTGNQVNVDVGGTRKITITGNTNVWFDFALYNSWTNYGGGYKNASYMKDAAGIVHLRGLIRNGLLNVTMCQLPTGYRPDAGTGYLIFTTRTSNGASEVRIDSSGYVSVYSASTTWLSFDGISFLAQN